MNLCQRLEVDLLIPGVDEELLPIAKIKNNVEFKILLPTKEFIVRHLDKLTSIIFLEQAGVKVPKTVAIDQGRIDFPCIFKPRSGRGSRNVVIVFSENELQAQITLARQPTKNYILQELLKGDEYTVMVVANSYGKLQAVMPALVECKRGITLRAITKRDNSVIKVCHAIHESNPVPGCYNIQLIKGADGFVKPFEINPRISTTACLGLAAGINFIDIFMGQSNTNSHENKKLLEFKEHLKLKRCWYNEFI